MDSKYYLIILLKQQDQKTKFTIGICSGGLLLAKAGVLENRKATTHILSQNDYGKFKNIKIVKSGRFVQDGKYITSGGITSGIDAALHLIEIIQGKDIADNIAITMYYDRYNDINKIIKKMTVSRSLCKKNKNGFDSV